MTGQNFREKVYGKSFRFNDSETIYTFSKDEDIITISENGKEKRIDFYIRVSETHFLIDTDGKLSDEMFAMLILSSANSPFSFKLWENNSKKIFGVFTEIQNV